MNIEIVKKDIGLDHYFSRWNYFHGRLISHLSPQAKTALITAEITVIALLIFAIPTLTYNAFNTFKSKFLQKASNSGQIGQDERLKTWNKRFKSLANVDHLAPALKQLRIELYEETLNACKKGFYVANQLTQLDSELTQKMIAESELCSPEKIEFPTQYNTFFEVLDEDTINLAKQYREDKTLNLNPVALNLANAHNPGGGVWRGDGCQEESIYRRSNYHEANPTKEFYPILEDHVIYNPYVQIFRSEELDYAKVMKEEDLSYQYHKPYPISFIAAAHINFSTVLNKVQKDKIKDLDRVFQSKQDKESRQAIETFCDQFLDSTYQDFTKKKMRAILRTALLKQYDSIVLGALGCGAFLNPAYLNAVYWKEIFEEKEFQGKFKRVGFAILTFGSPLLLESFKLGLKNNQNF